jgi:hypothetical protein
VKWNVVEKIQEVVERSGWLGARSSTLRSDALCVVSTGVRDPDRNVSQFQMWGTHWYSNRVWSRVKCSKRTLYHLVCPNGKEKHWGP